MDERKALAGVDFDDTLEATERMEAALADRVEQPKRIGVRIVDRLSPEKVREVVAPYRGILDLTGKDFENLVDDIQTALGIPKDEDYNLQEGKAVDGCPKCGNPRAKHWCGCREF